MIAGNGNISMEVRMESSQISLPKKKSRPWLLFVIGIPAVVIIYLAVAAVFIYTYDKSSPYSAKYGEAVELYHSGKLAEARKAFSEILDYEDSRKYCQSPTTEVAGLKEPARSRGAERFPID
jgi:hypothetical protein